jgi:hypothetical protein
MPGKAIPVVIALAMSIAGCNPFRSQAVRVNPEEQQNLYSRWSARIGTPSALRGAIAVAGTAWMQPSEDDGNTDVQVNLSNATPGGVHPWSIHEGLCGQTGDMVGDADDYQPIKIGGDGRGSARATIDFRTPTNGNYFVLVTASEFNQETVLACGNFAPPTP